MRNVYKYLHKTFPWCCCCGLVIFSGTLLPPSKENIICWDMESFLFSLSWMSFPMSPPSPPPHQMNFKVLISLCYPPYVLGMSSVTETDSAQRKDTNSPTHWRHEQLMCNVKLVHMPWWIAIAMGAVSNRRWKGCWLLPQVALVKQKEISVSWSPFVLAGLFFFFSELSVSPVMLNVCICKCRSSCRTSVLLLLRLMEKADIGTYVGVLIFRHFLLPSSFCHASISCDLSFSLMWRIVTSRTSLS